MARARSIGDQPFRQLACFGRCPDHRSLRTLAKIRERLVASGNFWRRVDGRVGRCRSCACIAAALGIAGRSPFRALVLLGRADRIRSGRARTEGKTGRNDQAKPNASSAAGTEPKARAVTIFHICRGLLFVGVSAASVDPSTGVAPSLATGYKLMICIHGLGIYDRYRIGGHTRTVETCTGSLLAR